MKGWRLRVICEGLVAFLLSSILTFWGKVGSWSENVFTNLHYILNGVLISVSWAFVRISERHPDKDESFYNWGSFHIRMRHLCNHIAYGFGAIAFFQMGNYHFGDIWHFAATGWSVINLAFLVTGYFKTWSGFWHLFTWPVLSAGLWLVGSFIWDVSLVRYPEYALLLIGLAFLVTIIIFKKRVEK